MVHFQKRKLVVIIFIQKKTNPGFDYFLATFPNKHAGDWAGDGDDKSILGRGKSSPGQRQYHFQSGD